MLFDQVVAPHTPTHAERERGIYTDVRACMHVYVYLHIHIYNFLCVQSASRHGCCVEDVDPSLGFSYLTAAFSPALAIQLSVIPHRGQKFPIRGPLFLRVDETILEVVMAQRNVSKQAGQDPPVSMASAANLEGTQAHDRVEEKIVLFNSRDNPYGNPTGKGHDTIQGGHDYVGGREDAGRWRLSIPCPGPFGRV